MPEYREIDEIILQHLMKNSGISSSEIHTGIGQIVGYATTKRVLQNLLSEGLIRTTGKGKSTKYSLSPGYFILANINEDEYFELEIDERIIRSVFNLELISEVLFKISLFTNEEMLMLESLQKEFQRNTSELTLDEFNREFERLAIDLSWKSSQIEGNTYSLLET